MEHLHYHSPEKLLKSPASQLTASFILTGLFLIVEMVAGIWTNSLALLSDAAHILTDTAGLAIALLGVKIGEWPADNRRTFGYKRLEILAAAFNAILLLMIGAYIFFEGYQRFFHPEEIKTFPMLLVALLGFWVNLFCLYLLQEGKDKSLNVKGAYLEVWSDLIASIGVLVAALLIGLTGWLFLDSFVAFGIGLWVLPRSWKLFKETMNVLLEGVPEGLDPDLIAKELKSISGVESLHDLHIWAITSGIPSLSAHLVVTANTDPEGVRKQAAQKLAEKFQIEHVTLQTEQKDCRDGVPNHAFH
ncbi:MAG: cation diffusion facilitator family transporter [Hyphomicrobium sp.]